jgi:hypothetical protein
MITDEKIYLLLALLMGILPATWLWYDTYVEHEYRLKALEKGAFVYECDATPLSPNCVKQLKD